jgi:hypothetical protein
VADLFVLAVVVVVDKIINEDGGCLAGFEILACLLEGKCLRSVPPIYLIYFAHIYIFIPPSCTNAFCTYLSTHTGFQVLRSSGTKERKKRWKTTTMMELLLLLLQPIQ